MQSESSGIITARTGEAYTAFVSYDPTNTGTGGPWPNRIHNPKDFSYTWPARQRWGARPPESRRSLASTIRRRLSSPTLLRDRPLPINLEIQAMDRISISWLDH